MKPKTSVKTKKIADLPVEILHGLGDTKKKVLNKIQIYTIEDLLYYFPRRYVDRSLHDSFFLREGEITILVRVQSSYMAHGKKSRLIVSCKTLKGQTVTLLFFNGLQYYRYAFQKDKTYIVSGKLELYQNTAQMIHPDVEALDEEDINRTIHSGGIIPVYSTTEAMKKAGLDSRGLRKFIFQALRKLEDEWEVPEVLPQEIREKYRFPSRKEVLKHIHYPADKEALRIARKVLKYEELFLFSVLMYKKKEKRKSLPRKFYPARFGESALFDQLKKNLPFSLTEGQLQAIEKMVSRCQDNHMQAFLLQGDVGSGKTIVAFSVALHYLEKGIQVAMMAPTELLARQHFQTLTQLPGLLPGVHLELLTGGETKKNREIILDRIKKGDSNFIIGTHSLIEPAVEFHSLGLVIIDEQHRFGVQQREALWQKGSNPDVIAMTATPIPRTLCLTIFGDLELVYLKEKPAGRKPVKTLWLKESQRQGLYKSIRKYVSQGRQCYIVYPVIEESEKLDLKAATDAYEELKHKIFPDFRVELIHGRMKPEERDQIMREFRNGKVQILVSTTVIEVGVDVPNATIMVIENAERFGISQLHQLRGRVGRGTEESFCVLMSDSNSDTAKMRLEAIVANQDGFALAEMDLKIRGPGELLGIRQHGIPEFRLSHIVKDRRLIEIAYRDAMTYSQIPVDGEKFIQKFFSKEFSISSH